MNKINIWIKIKIIMNMEGVMYFLKEKKKKGEELHK